ncbi:MAG: type II toxin-antitoxin system HicB family antitoxin [Candidatus Eremiobacteraeota bacterium]|nr:type II toxin-antitoxin system HicB family antitoxin [Candidatus Eremiobacteraeota bacterium]
MAELRYAVLIEPEPDGSAYNVIVPALPEIATFGTTPENALEMARDAITLSLEHRLERGLEIPPSDADSARLERVTVNLPAA